MASGQGSSLAEEAPVQTAASLSSDVDQTFTTVHFIVNDRHQVALVPKNSSPDDIKDMFKAACEAGPNDIIKLYKDDRLVNINQHILPNSPNDPYRLQIVAFHYNDILMEQIGLDLLSLEARVSALEHIYQQQSSPMDSISGLKDQVTELKSKLARYEHISWLGYFKALHPSPIPPTAKSVPGSPRAYYHKKSQDQKQIICDKFLKLCDVVLTKETSELVKGMDFNNWVWEDEEMLVLLQHMYMDLELPKKFDIEINILRNFLMKVYHHYNDVPFHNFRHCFMVTQMMYGMCCFINLPERIGELETLILLTSCICHDLDHPGYNNIYQINAQTELALRYNDISPLENHHCSIAFRLFEDPECNIFRNLPPEMFKKIREGMIRCILATDMARHNEIVNQFREIVPYFDRNNKTHVNLLTMVLIKVADISNEARPMDIAEPWLDCLFAEFFQQSDTEKLEGLPVTPFMDREKVTKPSSQCSFIGLVLLPLFEALGSLYTELDPVLIQPVRDALEYYRRLNEASQQARHRKSSDVTALQHASLPSTSSNAGDKNPSEGVKSSRTDSITFTTESLVGQQIEAPSTGSPPQPLAPMHHRNSNPMSYRRASQLLMIKTSGSSNSLKCGQPLKSASSGATSNYQSFPSLESDTEREDEGDETDPEDAITEVAVSEKALKFKIATESSFDFSSRKGSRENKSESSSHSNQAGSSAQINDRISYDTSMSSEVPKVEFIPRVSISAHGSPKATTSSASASQVPFPKGKAKESFFKRLKLFTERLSISVDSTSGGSAGSGGESPSTSSCRSQTQGFNYFRRPGKKERASRRQESLDTDPCSSSSPKTLPKRQGKHRGSISDPEGQSSSNFLNLRPSTAASSSGVQSEGEQFSPEYSPALSGTSGNKYWQPVAGSLDSILSKDNNEPKPSRRLMLPRLSSFVQRKSRMGFMNRSSRKPDGGQS